MDTVGADTLTTADLVRHYAEVRKRLRGKLRVVEPLAPAPEINPEPEPPPPRPPLTMHAICEEVCRFYKVRKLDFFSLRRFKGLVGPRQIAAWLCWKYTGHSSPAIGRYMHRDHTTILHAHKRVEAMIASDPQTAADIETIKQRLGAHELDG